MDITIPKIMILIKEASTTNNQIIMRTKIKDTIIITVSAMAIWTIIRATTTAIMRA